MSDPKNRIINICLREVTGGQSPPDLSESIMAAWAEEVAARGRDKNSSQTAQVAAPLSVQDQSKEAIIDVCLNEVVGETTPPDLKDNIIDAWIESQTAASRDKTNEPATIANRTPAGNNTGSIKRRAWLSWVTIASVLLIGSLLGVLAIELTQSNPRSELVDDSTPQPEDERQGPVRKDKRAPRDVIVVGPDNVPRVPFEQRNSTHQGLAQPSRAQPYAHVQPAPNAEIVAAIDQLVAKKWAEHSVTPVSLAGEDKWCRRVYLKLIGRFPTPEELQSHRNNSPSQRREQLVDRLLDSDEFAGYWSDYWTTVLIGRKPNGLANRNGLRDFLRRSLTADKPFNQVAYELVSATGSAQPGAKDYNGAVNFLLASMDKNGMLATSRTAKVFLGRRVQCVQCHDHHANEAVQREFWQMNAFFRQMKAEGKGKEVRLVNVDLVADKALVFYHQKDGQMRATYPVYPDGRPAHRAGKVAEFDRRTAIADYIRQAPELSRAIANRIWSHFFGFGFTKPIDDMGHHNPPSHPELLEHLAGQWTAHQFDLRKMMKWIALSKPFALSSRLPKKTDSDFADVPGTGRPLFSRYYTRSLQPDEVYRSLVLLSKLRKDGFDGAAFHARKQDWVNRSTKSLDTDEGEENNHLKGFDLAVELLNGQLAGESLQPGGVVHGVLNSKLSNDKKIEHLFLAAIARKPDQREREFVRQMIASHGGDLKAPLQDLWWALLNSNEFILDH